ncbi:MAG: NADH-quinone oxidoreductase subunit B [Gemmatimonadetes bacterium]|nr:NADH-quinone oxidoreductase subunit B [Gemmatimonadota bacterium]
MGLEGSPSSDQGGLIGFAAPTFLTTKIDFIVNWARRNSLWPMPFGTACCAIEMMAAAASNFDLARFGMERMAFSPRQADVLICAGRVPYKLAPVLRRIWDQMPQPKWCISMGACASTGGVFDTYCMVQGIDTIVPVDVYIPGCPPRPEGLIYGLMMIQEKIRGESLSRHGELRAEDPLLVGAPRANAEEVATLSGPFGNSTQQEEAGGILPSERPTMTRPERG